MPTAVLGSKSAGFITGSGTVISFPLDTDKQTLGIQPCDVDVFVYADKALTIQPEFTPDGSNWLPAAAAETSTLNVAFIRTYQVTDTRMRLTLTSTTTNTTYRIRIVIRSQAG